MSSSPLSNLPTFGSPTLENLEMIGSGTEARVRGKARQFVRFYKMSTHEVQTDQVKINEKTGDAVPISCKLVPVEREMVQIITPGDKTQIDAPPEEYHKREFFRQYQAYKQGRVAPLGNSVEECPYISSGVAIELKSLSINTEEQLADAADYVCSSIPNGWDLRSYAKARCQARVASKEPVEKLSVLTAALESSQATIRQMQEEMKDLRGRVLDSEGQIVQSKKSK